MAKVKAKYEALAGIRRETVSIRRRGEVYRYERWCADCGVSERKRIRLVRPTRSECVRAVNEWYAARKSGGEDAALLTPRQMSDAVEAFRVMEEESVTAALADIVRDYAKRCGEKRRSVSVAQAYETYYAKFGDQQEAQKEFVRGRVGRFAERFGKKMVCDLTSREIVRYLDSFEGWSPSTWNGHMDYIKTFLTWCAKTANGYCKVNPIADMERKAVMRKRPECASVEDVERVFAALPRMPEYRRDLMTLRMTLAFFCGMRTAEILRQDFDDIMLDERTIVVTEAKGEQSGGAGRAFRIPDTAMAWLRTVDMEKAKATLNSKESFVRWRKELFDDAAVDLPNNAGRHSFISYHVALHGNPRLTEGIVGTGDTMRKRHYDARVTHKAAEGYFAIMPPSTMVTAS